MPSHANCVFLGCPNRKDHCKWGLFPSEEDVQGQGVRQQARTQGFEKGGYIVKKLPLNFWHFNVKLFFSHDSLQE